VAMLAGLFEMIARMAVALLLVPALGFTGACFANPAAWVMADVFLIPCYLSIMRSLRGKVLPQTEPVRETESEEKASVSAAAPLRPVRVR